MHSVDDVLRIIALEVAPVEATARALSAGGVLAQDVVMPEDSPRFDRAMVDGFALRSADAAAGAELGLIGQIDAGSGVFSGVVEPGTCAGINTGAPVPAGADAVLMVEHSQRVMRDGSARVMVQGGVSAGFGIQKRGAEVRAGEIVLRSGTRLGAAQTAVCAAAGVAQPLIRKVRVAVLSTGDELVEASTPGPLPEGKIRNSNQVMLGALVTEAGATLIDLGNCPDERDRLHGMLERGMAEADLLVVCGGMSMGTRDLVPGMLKEMGVQLHVEKVRIKPGKPFILGTLGEGAKRRYVAGLPGNPVSSFGTFQRFVRAMLRRMEGATEAAVLTRARVDRDLAANGDREFYIPCALRGAGGGGVGDGGLVAEMITWRGSADIFSLAKANGLVIRVADAGAVAAGGEVEVMLF